MTYTLKNKTRRMKTFLLDHPKAKRAAGWVVRSSINPSTGKAQTKRQWVSVPKSLTLTAMGHAKNQPAWIAEVPDVHRAIKAGEVEFVREKQPTTKKPASKPSKRKKKTKE